MLGARVRCAGFRGRGGAPSAGGAPKLERRRPLRGERGPLVAAGWLLVAAGARVARAQESRLSLTFY